MKWQSIEAIGTGGRPYDGQPVLLIDARDRDPRPVVAWWEKNGHGGYEWRDCGDIGCNGQYDYDPTHWMPTPDAPFTGASPEIAAQPSGEER